MVLENITQTTTQLLLYCNNLYDTLGANTHPIRCYPDIAFDTTNYNIVRHKLCRFSFDRGFLKCFTSHLTGQPRVIVSPDKSFQSTLVGHKVFLNLYK